MRLVLYQPEIPQNTGTLLRLGACFGISIHIIEPCGFILNDRRLRRSGMDYLDTADLTRHASWQDFLAYKSVSSYQEHPDNQLSGNLKDERHGRIILLTPDTTQSYLDFHFAADDYLILGQESCGVPESVRTTVDDCVRIPMQAERRSLNVAIAGAIVTAEALRQTKTFPQ